MGTRVVVIVVVIDVVDDANSDRGEGLDEGKEWKDGKSVMFTFVFMTITIPLQPPGDKVRSNYQMFCLKKHYKISFNLPQNDVLIHHLFTGGLYSSWVDRAIALAMSSSVSITLNSFTWVFNFLCQLAFSRKEGTNTAVVIISFG